MNDAVIAEQKELEHLRDKGLPEDILVTHLTLMADENSPFPHREISAIFHRRDLSDVAEPYLSAILKARPELASRGA